MIKRLSQLLAPETRGEQIYIVILSVVAALLGLLTVFLIHETSQYYGQGALTLRYLILFFLVLLAFAIADYSAMTRVVMLVEGLVERVRVRVANQIRQSELPEIEKLDEAEIYVTMTKGSGGISLGARAAIYVLQSAALVMMASFYLLLSSPSITFFSLLAFFLLLGMYSFYYRRIIHRELHRALEAERELVDTFNHSYYGFKELKLSAAKRRDLYENYLQPRSLHKRDLMIRIEHIFADNEIFCSAIVLMLLGAVAFLFSQSNPPAVTLTVLTVLIFLKGPLQSIATAVPFIANAYTALDRQRRLENDLQFRDNLPHVIHDPALETRYEFDELTYRGFTYSYRSAGDESAFSLGPVDLTLHPGEVTFIMGGNGSGKSTLLKLLAGLYPAAAGGVQIDGRPVEISRHRYLFSAVFADFHLFDRLYGLTGLDADKVENWLRRLELGATRWQDGRFTNLDLSHGQCSRLALLAAVLEDKPVLLLDEWAAGQSPHFRSFFYAELLPELRAAGKVVVAVTHDEHFVRSADRVLLMENGRFVNA